jgi:N-acetylmuramic acid 6-phosphate etherase
LAALAPPVVLNAAEVGDPVAEHIVRDSAGELASAAAAAARKLNLGPASPVALAGGLLMASATYRERFLTAFADRGLTASSVALVTEPAEGAVRLALDMIAASSP